MTPRSMMVALGLVLMAGLVWATSAAASTRKALVVGIDRYDALPQLAKAVSDARAISDTLSRLGFRVHAGYDLNRRDFTNLLAGFIADLQDGDEALVFYAGHAVEIDRRNFLVPADATQVQQSNEALIISESVAQDFILQQVSARNVRLSVLIMDACRDNPFIGLRARSTGLARGLAIENPPQGTFLMFSADEGQQALDSLGAGDDDPNSIFTRTLLPLLETPGLDIVEIARQARGRVEALARSVDHDQFPEYRDRMRGTGRFVLTPVAAGSTASDRPAPLGKCDVAEQAFQRVPAADAAALDAFLRDHPDCADLVAQAQARLRALQGPGVTVVPAMVQTGDFVTIRADLPDACRPVFFNLAPSNRLTPIPNTAFRVVPQGAARTLWEITPDTDFALVVQDDDERGANRLGVVCLSQATGQADPVEVLRHILPELQAGRDSGAVSVPGAGQVGFATSVFTIR